jgi:TetR/AcrR family transcriptional repressor of nem operon
MNILHNSRTRLIEAAHLVVRAKGYSATRIEDICAEAGVTKGSFFHHFKSKDDLALAAIEVWDSNAAALFGTAPYHDHADPLDRLIAYVDYRKAILVGDLPEFTCFAGMIVQETYLTHPELGAAAGACIDQSAMTLVPDIRAAMERYGGGVEWTPETLARHIMAVVQGSFILAKAASGRETAAASLDHLRRYLELLFRPRPTNL